MIKTKGKVLPWLIAGLMTINWLSVAVSAEDDDHDHEHDTDESMSFYIGSQESSFGVGNVQVTLNMALEDAVLGVKGGGQLPGLIDPNYVNIDATFNGVTKTLEKGYNEGSNMVIYRIDGLTDASDISKIKLQLKDKKLNELGTLANDFSLSFVENGTYLGSSITLNASDFGCDDEKAALKVYSTSNIGISPIPSGLNSITVVDTGADKVTDANAYVNRTKYDIRIDSIAAYDGSSKLDSYWDDTLNVLYFITPNSSADVSVIAKGKTTYGESFEGEAYLGKSTTLYSANKDVLMLRRDFNAEMEWVAVGDNIASDGNYITATPNDLTGNNGNGISVADLASAITGGGTGSTLTGNGTDGNIITDTGSNDTKTTTETTNTDITKPADMKQGFKFVIDSSWNKINSDNIKASAKTAKLVDKDDKVIATIDLTGTVQYVPITKEGTYKLYNSNLVTVSFDNKLTIKKNEIIEVKISSIPKYAVKVMPTTNARTDFKFGEKQYATNANMVFAVVPNVKYAVTDLNGNGKYVTATDANPYVTVRIAAAGGNAVITPTDNTNTETIRDNNVVPNTGDDTAVKVTIAIIGIVIVGGTFGAVIFMHKREERRDK